MQISNKLVNRYTVLDKLLIKRLKCNFDELLLGILPEILDYRVKVKLSVVIFSIPFNKFLDSYIY